MDVVDGSFRVSLKVLVQEVLQLFGSQDILSLKSDYAGFAFDDNTHFHRVLRCLDAA